MDARLACLVEWIRVEAAEAKNGLLVPISGGSDSALCFWLANKALPGKVVGVHAGSPKTLRCRKWFASIGTEIAFVKPPGRRAEVEEMRWARFLALNLERRTWLVGCRNRTEDELHSYSLASRVATFLPIVGVWKSGVIALCQAAGVPAAIIAASRKADPDCGRPEAMAEIPFELVDLYLQVKLAEVSPLLLGNLTRAQRFYLEGIYFYNRFKSALPIRGPRV